MTRPTYKEAVARIRARYPFVVYRPHSLEPSPVLIDRMSTYGGFGRIPGRRVDEWRFLSEQARDRFIKNYGGQSDPY